MLVTLAIVFFVVSISVASERFRFPFMTRNGARSFSVRTSIMLVFQAMHVFIGLRMRPSFILKILHSRPAQNFIRDKARGFVVDKFLGF